ncbi:ssDNA-binding protein [Brevundimonas sp.]|jgi:hypothetical protein|uniref:ssDNA-binding protein n=1 Tax=Brevundimonas sp. TaxID=1871086 RepID=UPI003784AE89
MATKNKYYEYTLRQKARGLYVNLTEATKAIETAPTKYSIMYGLHEEDAKALFALEALAIKERYGTFTKPDDYQLCVVSGAKAAEKALANAALAVRGKSEEEAFKIKERAQARADLVGGFAGILTASSRTAFHDRFLDRYMMDLDGKERETADKFGFRLAVLSRPKPIVLDTQLSFIEHKDKFYRGAWYGGTVKLSPWDRKTPEAKDGVSAYLGNQIFVEGGERLAGSAKPIEDEFGHYQGAVTDYSPSDAAKVDEHAF